MGRGLFKTNQREFNSKKRKGSNMKTEDGKFIFTEEELNKFIEKITYQAYKEGITDAWEQMKYAVETENDGTFQVDEDFEDDHWPLEDVG